MKMPCHSSRLCTPYPYQQRRCSAAEREGRNRPAHNTFGSSMFVLHAHLLFRRTPVRSVFSKCVVVINSCGHKPLHKYFLLRCSRSPYAQYSSINEVLPGTAAIKLLLLLLHYVPTSGILFTWTHILGTSESRRPLCVVCLTADVSALFPVSKVTQNFSHPATLNNQYTHSKDDAPAVPSTLKASYSPLRAEEEAPGALGLLRLNPPPLAPLGVPAAAAAAVLRLLGRAEEDAASTALPVIALLRGENMTIAAKLWRPVCCCWCLARGTDRCSRLDARCCVSSCKDYDIPILYLS